MKKFKKASSAKRSNQLKKQNVLKNQNPKKSNGLLMIIKSEFVASILSTLIINPLFSFVTNHFPDLEFFQNVFNSQYLFDLLNFTHQCITWYVSKYLNN
ncbi:hypothetical protein QWT87_13370 [Chryseobacterium sp. APV1]|uniref:Uncharacterized protein n=1 Tax=Chryseobacterium urinae TaxID=3058400 RepID=A0ABT8U6V6_9FLAO|nr:hypothetical protein [Chryseobacterium sp. APV1]MDO3425885.1 hypothetical protein [Chryseobacterium sp. APV1]